MYTYDARKNNETMIVGVPLRDLDAEDLSRLNKAQLAAITAAPFYIKVEPKAEPVAPAPSKGKESK